MTSTDHALHLQSRTSHSACSECRADTERQFVPTTTWSYGHVHDYLTYIRPRLNAIRNGADDVDARIWRRKFLKALHTRISLKAAHPPVPRRKHCDSYLERLQQFARTTSADYLRRFASRGASCLDY